MRQKVGIRTGENDVVLRTALVCCHCSVRHRFVVVLLAGAHCVEQEHSVVWGEIKEGTSSYSPTTLYTEHVVC